MIRKPSHKYRQKYSQKYPREYLAHCVDYEQDVAFQASAGADRNVFNLHSSAVNVRVENPKAAPKDAKACSQSLENFELWNSFYDREEECGGVGLMEFVEDAPEQSQSKIFSPNRGQFELKKISRVPNRKPKRIKASGQKTTKNQDTNNGDEKSLDKFEDF